MKKLVLLIAVFTIALVLPSIAQTKQTSTTATQTKAVATYSGVLPSATLAGLKGGDITFLNLTNTDTLSTSDRNFTIISFSFSAKVNGAAVNIASNSNQINSDMKASIKKLVVGNQVLFNNIKAKYKPAGSIHDLAGMTFTIK